MHPIFRYTYLAKIIYHSTGLTVYRVIANEWTPFHTGFELFLIVLGKSDENMPYWVGLGDSFAILYIAVTYLVQELY